MNMRVTRLAAMCGFLALAACSGGGGGGVASTSPPPTGGGSTPTPTPANTAIADLKASQTFTSDATTTNVDLTTAGGIVGTTAASRATVQVSYDAPAKSYTVTIGGRSQVFAASDAQPQRTPGEAQYRHGSDYLTLVTTPYYSATSSNRYVGMGYWQHNDVASGRQTTQFSTFAYGLATPAADVPRTGGAHWKTDIFGMVTTPGQELRTIQGSGGFDVDFAGGVFIVSGNVDEFNYITGGGRSGSLPLNASGRLTSGNGFQGDISYSGGAAGPVAGTITGQFYGPGAEEIGASFLATGVGGVLTGALTGQRDGTTGASTSLLDVRTSQRLFSNKANFTTDQKLHHSDYGDVKAYVGNTGFVTVTSQGPGETSDGSYGYTPVASDLVNDGRANFTTYRTTIDGAPTEVAYYRVGAANTELQLSYLSFAVWTRTTTNTVADTSLVRYYLPYGFETARGLLAARTGTASYSGVVYGSGASLAGARYDIGGGAQFAIDFSNARYSGSLALTGQAQGGGSRDFGSFTFSGLLNEGQMTQTAIDGGGFGSRIAPVFYGPGGQEIGAPFALTAGAAVGDPNAVLISGVALAKQR